MTHLLIFSFPYGGPWGAEMTDAAGQLARDIAAEPGLICKFWLENPRSQKSGGVYIFDTEDAAARYRQKHRQRLIEMGYADIEIQHFALNGPLSALTGVPDTLLQGGPSADRSHAAGQNRGPCHV